jgi:hypothetical protein
MSKLVILPKIRDPRFITVRRGGTLRGEWLVRRRAKPTPRTGT